MATKYWAKRGKNIVGPFETQEAALEAFRAQFPFKKAAYMAKAKNEQIMTGYGEFGPSFNMQWHDAI